MYIAISGMLLLAVNINSVRAKNGCVVVELAKALVVYGSVYGNTEKIAKALAQGVEAVGVDVDLATVSEVDLGKLVEYDFLAIGAPTQAFGIYKPVKEFLERLNSVEGLKGKKAFAFDTKMKSRLAGSAAKGIEKKLASLGLSIVKPHASAIVNGREGPLEEGAEETFKRIGAELAKAL